MESFSMAADADLTVFLDDDPTGAQDVADVSVVLDASVAVVRAAARRGDRALHVVTNSRAYAPEEAARLTAAAATAVRSALPDARIALRGDSTLRGHAAEEYEALRGVLGATGFPPYLLVPAMPAAGRVTRAGVHLLLRDGRAVPLHRTEYARDGALSYSTSDLAGWADERSRGRMRADRAHRVGLAALRGPAGVYAVAEALAAAWQEREPAVVVPDAETLDDLAIIADGLRHAERRGVPVIVRCSPAFAAVLTDTRATRPAPAPAAPEGVLVLCGSFVPTTTVQLAALDAARPGLLIEAGLDRLLADPAEHALDDVVEQARALVAEHGLAIVATPRQRSPALADADSQRRVAVALAGLVPRIGASVVVAKGGITSAVAARVGRGAAWARVAGPVLPGVSLWMPPNAGPLLVVPGNVGGPGLLVELVERIDARTPRPVTEVGR